MIRNQWYVILESWEVRRGRPVGVTRMGEKLVLWRDQAGKVACVVDQCPHLGAQLSQGQVCEGRLACPFHGFEFDASGQCRYIPALGKNGAVPKAMLVNAYPTYEANGFIWIYWGKPRAGLREPCFVSGIDDSFSSAGARIHWPVHYSRVVENQLDMAHLPFIHRNTIGRGNRPVVDGPVFTLEDDIIHIWVYNRADDGRPPLKMDEIPTPSRPYLIEFVFPNLWQNRLGDDLRLVVAFVPVDEENAIMYIRHYQRFVKLPILRDVVNQLSLLADQYIANEDRRIVSHQMPKKTDLYMNEKPIQADRVILAYRRRRKELQEAAGAAKE